MKRPFHLSWIPLATIALIAGCASARVTTDWDREAKFSGFKTYSWSENAQMRSLQQNSLFDKRLRAAVGRQLGAKGLHEVESGGDMLVAYHAGVAAKTDFQQTGYFGRKVSVRQYKEGTLVLDILDGRNKQLVWRGTAAGEVTKPGGSSEQLDKAVQKMFADFPPAQ